MRTDTEEELLNDFAVSDWLKQQIIETKNRDILDVLNDCELLLSVAEQRCIAAGLIQKQ